jgi:probable O-glycosylation ligase (exosortase A-associated)
MASMVLCAAAALGSHSRGALLALGAMTAVLWWRSEKKGGAAVILVGAALLLIPFMPDEWTARMSTIKSYDRDESAMGRINAWWMAWNLASKNLFGGGFFIWTRPIFEVYAPVKDDVHAAHSIYFQILGEHGFIGLFLFLTLWLLTWFKAGRLMKVGRAQPETMWVAHLGAMTQVSLVGYAVGGAFLSLSYFDLPYNIMVVLLACKYWLREERWKTETTGAFGSTSGQAAKAQGGSAHTVVAKT